MDDLNQTAGPNVGSAPLTPGSQVHPDPLEGLNRCLSATYVARARLHLDLGDTLLAVADMREAFRHTPASFDPSQDRSITAGGASQVPPVQAAPDKSERDESSIDGGNTFPGCFQEGYQVLARYDQNNYSDQPLCDFPLTETGRLEAIGFARHMCSESSRTLRSQLYDAHRSGGEDFDVIVIEYRSLVRQVHLERGVYEDGTHLTD